MLHDKLVRYRRHFHENPERSLQEFETAKFVERELREYEFDDLRVGVGKTGILATLKGKKPGPVTLLRADMDALPIQELNETEYVSKNPGVMHACGHDGHTSILLTAAQELAKRREEIPGTLVLCFQPGEEGLFGAKLMIEDGALENPHVDRTFALHLFSGLEVGKIGVREGPFFASSDQFELILTGKGGHGAMPQGTIDPVIGAAHVVSMLQTIVSREIAPKDPVVITVGKIESGTTFNVIPDTATLLGTVRAFTNDVRVTLPEKMERIIKGVCEALRLDYTFRFLPGYPPVINNRAMNEVVRKVGSQVLGAENVVDFDIVMGSEDMSYMMDERQGAYFIVGVAGENIGREPMHSARFDMDERALDVGLDMMMKLALHG